MSSTLRYIVNNVFMPPKLPQSDDYSEVHDLELCLTVLESASEYQQLLPEDQRGRWSAIIKMLKNLAVLQEYEGVWSERLTEMFDEMETGDFLSLLVRAQNAGMIIRKSNDTLTFEMFEAAPPAAVVMAAEGKLLCCYPGPAMSIHINTFEEPGFHRELASFLGQMNVDVLDSAATTTKAGVQVTEERDTADPRYITELLAGILLGIGQPAEVTRFHKHIGDDVLWKDAKLPWRRAMLWLVIRVALQSTLRDDVTGHVEYKSFMLYILAAILKQALEANFDSDLLYCMRAKLCRKASKLGASTPEFMVKEVREICTQVQAVLVRRWNAVRDAQNCLGPWNLSSLNFSRDTALTLYNCREYLLQIGNRDHTPVSSATFQPTAIDRLSHITNISDLTSSRLSAAFQGDTFVALADFELVVRKHLDGWVERVKSLKDTPRVLYVCIDEYAKVAIKFYDSSPEDLSLALLTIFDLWVALDQVALVQCPLMKDYSPEVPPTLLQNLLLCKAEHLERLVKIQMYLRSRHASATKGTMFSNVADANSFRVRYFDQDTNLRNTMASINAHASAEKSRKLAELESLNQQHHSLVQQAASMDHTERTVDGFQVHKRKKCAKCRTEKQASSLTIDMHEWPLPDNTTQAKVVIFELVCPDVVACWRDTLYNILYDIGTPPRDRTSNTAFPHISLPQYKGLSQWASCCRNRITLASVPKSFSRTHYAKVKIPSEPHLVCVKNGLDLRLFDTKGHNWATSSFEKCSIHRFCSIQLPPHSAYSDLQYAVDDTRHSFNEVIASQSLCPRGLSIHEYTAFAGMRSGERLQWLNVVREISARTISLNRDEVHTLLTQISSHVGVVSQLGTLEWHEDLSSLPYGHVFLDELELLLHQVKGNWLEVVTMRSIILLISRLLASATEWKILARSYSLMRTARLVVFGWLQQLSADLLICMDNQPLKEMQRRVFEVAVTCRATYDVDPLHLQQLLQTADDVAMLMECAILACDNIHDVGDSTLSPLLVYRNRRLSHFLEPYVWAKVEENREGLDKAISSIWQAYHPGQSWSWLASPTAHWVTSRTSYLGAAKSGYVIHVNLLTGQMMVNGKPLSRLPPQITNHPTFIRLFGKNQILFVVPGDSTGMNFITRISINNYEVHFSLRSNGELVIRTVQEENIHEFVPHTKLQGDFPSDLVDSYAHWFHISRSRLEFRLLSNPWATSSMKWCMTMSAGQLATRLLSTETASSLIDSRSETFLGISSLLRGIELPRYLIVSLSSNGLLTVDLHRLKLSFFVNEQHELECKNLPGMFIDANQDSSTMYGLSSRLVLRSASHAQDPTNYVRRLLIPRGVVSYTWTGDSTAVSIDTSSQSVVHFHEYLIDDSLGRLVGDGGLFSRLYQVYLHALTSQCIPDPLTQRTGTEEALHELISAGCLSFQKLSNEETDILKKIATLTPLREYYPPHRRVMQTVHWQDLPPTSQHHHFKMMVGSIFQYARSLSLFDDSSESSPTNAPNLDRSFLEKRDYTHKYGFYTHLDFEGCELAPKAVIHLRHPDLNTTISTSKISSSLLSHLPPPHISPDKFLESLKSVESMQGIDHRHGLSLSYSRRWLELDVRAMWLPLYDACCDDTRSTQERRVQLLFSLSAWAYRYPHNASSVHVIAGVASNEVFQSIVPPVRFSYRPSAGNYPDRGLLLRLVSSHAVDFGASPASTANLVPTAGQPKVKLKTRRKAFFRERIHIETEIVIENLLAQWPCRMPQQSTQWGSFQYLRAYAPYMKDCRTTFEECYDNLELYAYIDQVRAAFDSLSSLVTRQSCLDVPTPAGSGEYHGMKVLLLPSLVSKSLGPIWLSGLLLRCTEGGLYCNDTIYDSVPSREWSLESPQGHDSDQQDLQRLDSLIFQFWTKGGNEKLIELYARHLEQSREALQSEAVPVKLASTFTVEELAGERDRCSKRLQAMFDALSTILKPVTVSEEFVSLAQQWPRITPRTLLERLNFKNRASLSKQWRDMLTCYAKLLLEYQRMQRLIDLLVRDSEEFFRELRSTPDQTIENLDWLLIQIDAGFSARPVQITIAKEMIMPSSGRNSVLQLNMGEGKSSVIVPMAASALADGTKFVRIVVLKSLASQMFQLLVDRLTGLANRRVFYMPFSRQLRIASEEAIAIQRLQERCMREGGILVIQPEHILSQKLMCIDRLLTKQNRTATTEVSDILLESARWLATHSRDILDESDEILHVRYQVIYTVGYQRALEDHPDRWTTVQQVLSLARKHMILVQRLFPEGIEVRNAANWTGSFPEIRILHREAGQRLVQRIANDIINGALHNFPFHFISAEVRGAAYKMITEVTVSTEEYQLLEGKCREAGSWGCILLLRGLLAHGILLHVLMQKRWRVDYGLDLTRTMLAVPYRAKDVPSLRSEFGHPDVAILFTCLTYYYQGLTQEQLIEAFEQLFKQDDPTIEYQKWIEISRAIPSGLRHFTGVNIKDERQRETYLFPLFHRNRAVVDFFLAQIVFPKQAKEFPHKLSTSGWDLAEEKSHYTTGFSGTNDNQYLLPTSIQQHDPAGQGSTNALVLSYLLQDENDCYQCMTNAKGELLSSEEFLKVLVKISPEVRVLLDVGAQMLELRNRELASKWLSLSKNAQAAIFFNERDEMAVITKDGTIEPLLSSPFRKQLDKCLVYLDDAHTRGTDLKLPRGFRAAVTLGPKVTKDRLVQGCMRMRKLGHGHSVMFFAPPAIDRAIRAHAGKVENRTPAVADVLIWSMHETCADIEHYVPLWMQQGEEYMKRSDAWKHFNGSGMGQSSLGLVSSTWLQPEARALEEMYGVVENPESNKAMQPELQERCRMLGAIAVRGENVDEEQEREVQHEVEREQQIERPRKASAASHRVHKNVRSFIRTGRIIPGLQGFVPLFSILTRTSSPPPKSSTWSQRLYATVDFAQTVIDNASSALEYLKPVNWIVSGKNAQGENVLVVFSPFEVNKLLPAIRRSNAVQLHLYSPKVTEDMRSFETLDFLSIQTQLLKSWEKPDDLTISQLNLFAGQLYFSNYETYTQLCNFLGIHVPKSVESISIPIQADGFVKSAYRSETMECCPFDKSPVPFLKELVGLRRKGNSFLQTHVGMLLHGRTLSPEVFEKTDDERESEVS